MIRNVLEKLMKNWVLRRRLPADFNYGVLYVSPSAGLRYVFRRISSIDPPLLRCARELVKNGDVIWDIGANVGLFSVAAAVRSGAKGEVVAFEPDAWLVELLRKTKALQPRSNAHLTIVPIAVAESISIRPFSIAVRSRASNALSEYGHTQMGGTRETIHVPTFNLDWLLTKFPAPDILKIDVEGAELEVIRHQTRTLNEVRPTIICEVAADAAEEITRILTVARYRLYDGQEPLDRAKTLDHACWNTVAIPDEKVWDITSSSVTSTPVARSLDRF